MLDNLYFVYNARAKDPGQRVEILVPKILPDAIQYNYQPNFQSQSLIGRRSPVFLYTGGSPRTYNFSLKIHEDILDSVLITENGRTFKPESIVQLVDHFKMLAYPITETNGTIKYPQMYFEIGEIAGYGIVKVSVSWEKPFRDLRYIQATVTFDVTVETEVSMPTEPQIGFQETDWQNLVYDYKINLNMTEQEAELLVQRLGPAFNSNVADLISEGEISQFARTIKQEVAVNNFNYQVERIQNIYSLFKTATGQETIEELAMFKEIESFTYEQLVTKDGTDAKEIRKIKNSFRDYLDYYYDNINTKMTRDEYFQVLDSVFTLLENLQKYAEEIYGYGQSS